jgi:hypothetical protein
MHERDDEQLSGGERELEAALRGLKPGATSVDPVACAFEAGRTAGARRVTAWRSTTAALSLALIVSILIPARSATRSSRENATIGGYATVLPLPRTNQPTYFSTRDAVLDRGVDVLPASTGSAKPMSMRGL